MTPDQKIVGIAIRVETEDDDLFVVFKIIDPKIRMQIKNDWDKLIEFKILGTDLVLNDAD